MQFTPQQLMGAGRYAPVTRIGNWNEDLMLEEARRKEFLLRKQQGSLLATHKMRHDFLHQRVPRSFDPQQQLRFNHAVGIVHEESHGVLSCNVFEESPSVGAGEFLVTVSSSATSIARNTFRVISPTQWKETVASGVALDWSTPHREPLCYGDDFLLMCNESLLVDDQSVLLKTPLFLKSGLKSERSMSPITYNQRVWLAPDVDSAALWTATRADLAGAEKMLSAGSEIRAGDAIAIIHKMTGQPLHAESTAKQPTDLGVELEASTFCAKTAGRHHNLAAEAIGQRMADTEGRASLTSNRWTFQLAATPQDARDARLLPGMATPASVLDVLRSCAMTESVYSFRMFLVGLMKLETSGTGIVSRDEAKLFAMRAKPPLREDNLDVLFTAFDRRNVGHVRLDELLAAFRVPTPDARKAQIDATFDRLSHGGKVMLRELVQRYDPTIDSRVRDNQLTDAAARSEYQSMWQLGAGAEVSRRQFEEVYSDISATIEHDEHFARFLDESWNEA